MSAEAPKPVVIIGAGPGGLTAAYLLGKRGRASVVLEKDLVVGGLSRTVRHQGYHFDIGGHRFFTKVKAVEDLWHELLPDSEFPLRRRLSRIHYNGRFFNYPLRAANALFGLGPLTSLLVLLSYARAQLFPIRDERTFEDWVTNRFGRRLFDTFFKTYTEKVWGIPCSELSADWAAQRIRGLSLVSAVLNALLPAARGSGDALIKTLIDAFHYPRFGPGQMWQVAAERIRAQGSSIRLGADVERIHVQEGRIVAVDVRTGDALERQEGSHFVSTMPLRELVLKLDPRPPAEVAAAAAQLSYRDFLTVALVVARPDVFPDNWIYIHDPEVRVGRVQNFGNWSPDMVPEPGRSCLGLEYFCFEGDGLWTSSDAELVALASRELALLGLVRPDEIVSGQVVRMPKAYPVYDGVYAEALASVRSYTDRLSNLHLIGRNGMHRYNNQDHSMLTAMLAVENILGACHDIWSVNVEARYHEELDAARASEATPLAAAARELDATQPRVPERLPAPVARRIVERAFARLLPVPFGLALGSVFGLYAFLATAWLLLRGGDVIGPHLQLLGQFFLGYRVSWTGSVVGALYAGGLGFLAGFLVASGRNACLSLYLHWARRQAEAESLEGP